MDSAGASKTKRPAKKSKKHRKAEGSASRTTLEPVGGAGVRAASVGTAWLAPPTEDADKRSSSASGSDGATASAGPDAPSIAVSHIAAPNKVTECPKTSAYTSGLPTQGAGRQPASAAFAGRKPGAVDSPGATSAVAAGGQVKDAVQSSGSFQLLATGPGNPEQASTRSVSPFATSLAASAATQLGEGTTSSPPSSVQPGGRQKFSLVSSPEAVGSRRAEIIALLGLNKPSSRMSACPQTGSTSSPTQVVPTSNSALAPRRAATRRKEYPTKMSTHSRNKSVHDSEALGKLHELTLVKRDEATAAPTRRYWMVAVFLFVFILALVAVGLISFLVHRSRAGATPTGGERFCRSSGCLDHADTVGLSDIANGLHKSSPCEDFGRFICSAWVARHERNNVRRRITQTVLADALTDHVFSMADFISQQHALSITKRPERMMNVCFKNRPSDDTKVLDQLSGFMKRSGFGYPAENVSESDYSKPLTALAELAYNWALPLWFYVDLAIPPSVESRTLTLSPAAFGDFYAVIHEAITEYEDVYTWFVNTLVETVYRGSIGASFREFTRGSKLLQKAVFGNLSQVTRFKYHMPALLKIKRVPHFVVNTTVEHWLKALGPLWSVDPPISQEDVVYFPDRRLLTSMDTLFKTYTARDIYLHVHWWFVQILGVLASNVLFGSFRRDPERGEFTQKVICSIQAAVNYNAIFSSEKRARLHPSERADIMRRLGNIHAIAVSKVSSAMGARFAWLLEHMKPVLWLPGPYASEERLLRLYGTETNNATTDEDTFVGRWLSRAASYQRSSNYLDERSADSTVFRTDSSVVSSHHVMTRAISLSLALLRVPFYYPNASSAVFYGGLGFIYATELVRVLNSLSLLLDGGETIEPSPAGLSKAYVWAAYSCSGMNVAEIFPHYMALEIAYDTYRQFRSDAEDVSLWNAQGYTPEQVFFATTCYSMCNVHSGPRACTKNMKHFPEFATAFSCPSSFAKEPCDILD
ncbi:uncharacterized protein [Dermacentor albipictus]|uniref:uncharacterized protein isoform X1 n=1 Tax=Dermacentor albipictus TaxID=60249 RepID=UPI0038FCCBB4